MDYQNNYTQKPPQKNTNNTGLIIAVTVLACVLVVVLTVVILMATGCFDKNTPDPAPSTVSQQTQQSQPQTQQQQQQQPQPTVPQPVPVQQTMYVDCNVYLTLRTGPATSYPEITTIPVGSSLYVIEYTNSEFAKVSYNGSEGYVARQYLSTTQPYVWHYDEFEVENFVASSLKGYVNGINTGDTSFAYSYFSDAIVNNEINSVNTNRKAVYNEEILSLNCHSVKRVSKTKVTVIRDSVIKAYYHNGDVKDITEKFIYTVEYINNRMYITNLKAM